MNYFDNASFRMVMRRFFWPVPLSRDTRFSMPRTHSIEFIRSGQIFLNRKDKTILLTAPVLFWMHKGENFIFSGLEGEKKPCEHLYCDFSGEKADRMLTWLDEVCPEGFLRLKSLADLADRIYTEREQARIMPDESITMQSLLIVGTSAGGRQPKAIIAINRKTGEIRSGQISGLKNYDYCLLKFGNTQYSSAELEMTYYELAIMAGIRMMTSELYTVDGNNHFITKRFDRDGERKIYTQTLAAVSPDADSYEQLIAVCRKLHLPESDCQEVFRRMVFNILANNTDDHNKNFSFIMDEDGSWRLSPAYDITYIIDNGGFLPNEDHCLYIRTKLRNITREDAILFARDNGIRRPDAIIRDVVTSLKLFRTIAKKYGVSEQWTGRVETTIIDHLKSWGEWQEDAAMPELTINGHLVSNIRMEQAYKGNYHLLAEIDGKECKFVIGKNKEEFALIEKTGIANLTLEQLQAMIEKYFFFLTE